MKAYRYRLIFWPVFCGAAVFSLASKSPDGLLWPTIDGGIFAILVFAVVYGADRNRRGSRLFRTGVILAGMAGVGFGLWNGDLFSGAVFAVLFVIALGILYVPSVARKVHRAR